MQNYTRAKAIEYFNWYYFSIFNNLERLAQSNLSILISYLKWYQVLFTRVEQFTFVKKFIVLALDHKNQIALHLYDERAAIEVLGVNKWL